MQVLLTGASGLVGRALTEALVARGDVVVGVTRQSHGRSGGLVRAWVGWDEISGEIDGVNAVVHLAGAGIGDRRWSASRKQELRESRIETARTLVQAMERAATPPAVFLSASAVGYYGPGTTPVDETAGPGSDFMATLCEDWERAGAAEGVRTAQLRFGVVLSDAGGALKKLLLPFKLGLGGPVGRGRQFMSWVHLDDAVGGTLYALDQPLDGPLNVTSPNPVTNRAFSAALGKTLRRPVLLPTPPPALKLLLGEGASVVTQGQRVLPAKLLAAGYTFQHPEIGEALASILRPAGPGS